MLQIENIKKTYVTGELTQTALNDVSLSFRESELVAILGPSGSGKSTLLNVIGGLDQYDSGDLIIDGISTKKYKDRDWDSYRNHSVGFIFQSYNLIPHQNVLSNVELALTISGIPAGERKKRAIAALKEVGLEAQIHKKPNQMSGGQMQRVAIARALVNNPKILLADEPTGALDSETSIQVMELLKEVAKDRLVIMVTHNPELAQQYATRIVRVKDGKILDDSNPYHPDIQAKEPPKHKNMGRASMGFGSALRLSLQNLWTKKTRTLLTSFAGSIGIIGIALILSLSAGFQAYVDSIQRDTLANYPLSFQAETADMSAAFMSMMMPDENPGEEKEGTVLESQMLARMFAHIGVNDLKSFKAHIDAHQEEINEMVNSIQYSYGIRPRIFLEMPEQEPFQVNPATLFKEITGNDGISAMMDVDAFQRLPEDREMLDQQYEILTGRWPEEPTELVFILPMGGRLADQTAYTLGLKSMDHMDHMLELMEEGLSPITDDPPMEWTYEELLELTYKWVPSPDFYRYNDEFKVWEDLSSQEGFLEEAVRSGTDLHVVGVAAPRDGSSPILMPGLGYPDSFLQMVIADAAQSEIVKAQLQNPEVDVFSGVKFKSDEDREAPDFASMISIDQNSIKNSFGVNFNEKEMEALLKGVLEDVMDAAQVDTTPAKKDFVRGLQELSTAMLLQAVEDGGGTAVLELQNAEAMVKNFLSGSYASSLLQQLSKTYHVGTDVFVSVYEPLMVGMVSGIIGKNPAPLPPSPGNLSASAGSVPYLTLLSETTLEAADPLPPEEDPLPPEEDPIPPEEETDPVPPEQDPDNGGDSGLPEIPELPDNALPPLRAVITEDQIEPHVSAFIESPMVTESAEIMGAKMMEAASAQAVVDRLTGMDRVLTSFLQKSFYVNSDQLTKAFQFNMDEEQIRRLFEAMMNGEQARSAPSNLRKLGYADLDDPFTMNVYFKDFDSKELFLNFLEDYNQEMRDADQEGKVIRYTDMTGRMMDSVRIIINSVSYVLIAFVGVSLVVSSIMIGIITYISVMERTKEIGVLRAMGASKHNISQVFNAETFLIGLCSGILGIAITLALLIPGNQLLLRFTGNQQITAQLPWVGAIILILLSMLLTLIGGLIPSKQAAKKDPVIALRSE